MRAARDPLGSVSPRCPADAAAIAALLRVGHEDQLAVAPECRAAGPRPLVPDRADAAARAPGALFELSGPAGAQPVQGRGSFHDAIRPHRGEPVNHVGRNERCPCGSGKKYKRCCLPQQQTSLDHRHDDGGACPHCGAHEPHQIGDLPPGVDGDALNDMSARVMMLIRERRFDDALVGAQLLLADFPGVHDGLETSALIHDALGNHATALDYWQRLLDFVENPIRRQTYDDRLVTQWKQSRDQARQLASPRAEAEHASDGAGDRAR